jgi:regulator of sirC expression with transglutaminase-like and TPR domain
MNDSILHLGLIDDEAIVLDAAALELSALDHPGTNLDAYVETLTAITERLAAVGGDAQSSLARAEVLSQVIANEFGFAGDPETYDDPANADMIRVMDRRRGLPVSLSILYVAAARRLSWPAQALNTPGHVITEIGEGTAPVLIDPFNDGAIVRPEQLAALLAQALGPAASATSEHLAPMTNRAVLVRLLLNQATRAERAGDHARALTLYERMTIIAPSSGHAWWELARLQLMHRNVSAARSSLSAMLEMTRDPATRTHIAAALDSLAGTER